MRTPTLARHARTIGMAIVLVALAGCQTILGIHARSEDPLMDGCTLPQVGPAKLRVANLVPSDEHVDFCVRASGGASWGRPVLRGGGTGAACQSGFAYTDVSLPFGAPLGSIDVKAITAGSTCGAPALSEIDGVTTSADHPVSVHRIGGAGQPERLVSLDDQATASGFSLSIRFLHAAVGLPPLRFGIAADSRLPTTVTAPVVDALVAFGAIATGSSSLGPISNGYLTLPGDTYDLGASLKDDPKALLVQEVKKPASLVSLIAIGNGGGDADHPVRGLFCDEAAPSPDGLRTACTQTALGTISIDVWGAALYGSFSPPEQARRRYIDDAITSRLTDVMCITSVSRKSDRDQLVADGKAGGVLLYSVTAATDLDTVPNDPRDQNGITPPPPTTPPCGGNVNPRDVDAAYGCMVQRCNSGSGDSGTLSSGKCLTASCAASLIPLYAGALDAEQCFDCMAGYALSGVTFGQNKLSCTTDSRAPFTFNGEAPSLILSRFEIAEHETYVFASTTWRRVIHYAKLKLEQNKTVDFYCAQLEPLVGDAMPYVGPYGPDGLDGSGWAAEQLLQARRTVEYVKSKSGQNPAIVVGDWGASLAPPGSGADGGAPDAGAVRDSNPDVIRILSSPERGFGPEAVPSAFAANPECTLCPTSLNPYNNAGIDDWHLRPYTLNMQQGAGVAASVLWKDRVVPGAAPDGTNGPLSDSFLFNVQILRP